MGFQTCGWLFCTGEIDFIVDSWPLGAAKSIRQAMRLLIAAGQDANDARLARC
jgi:hypothetical protein